MHESRMIAVVVPPGVCAIEKVSGSRIATPFAPPSPGSTPMMTPRMMPTNMNATFLKLSATTKPWSNASISAIALAHAQRRLERPLGQRHQEPDFEDEKEHHAVADAHRDDFPPRVFAEPAHEKADEERGGDIDAEPADQPDIDRGRDEHDQHQRELVRLDERAVLLAAQEQRAHQVGRRGETDEQPDVEGKVARLGPVFRPARAQAHAVPHDERAKREKERRDEDLGALVAESRSAHFWCRKPAAFMSWMWRCSSFATQSAYCLPSSDVVLYAPCSMRAFQSGVCCTLRSTST